MPRNANAIETTIAIPRYEAYSAALENVPKARITSPTLRDA